MKKILFAVSCCLGLVGAAEEVDYSTWMQYSSGEALLGAAWKDPADPSVPAAAAVAGKSYYVPSSKHASFISENAAFAGDVMAVAGSAGGGKYGVTYTIPELRLLPGGIYKHGSWNYLEGTVRICGTKESPSKVSAFIYNSNRFYHKSKWISDSTAAVKFYMTDQTFVRENFLKSYFDVTGDWSEYNGILEVANAYFYANGSNQNMPGTLKVSNGGIVGTNKRSGEITLGGLDLSEGAELLIKYNSTIDARPTLKVTDSIKLSGEFKINLDGASQTFWTSNYNKDILIARYTGNLANADVDVSKAVVNSPFHPTKAGPLPHNVHLAWKENKTENSWDLVVTWDPTILMIKDNGSYDPATSAFAAGNESYWSDGYIPDSTYEGWVYCGEKWLTMPAAWTTYSYPNMRLVAGKSLRLHCNSLIFKDVYFTQNATIASYSGPVTSVLDTPVYLMNNPKITVEGRGNHRVTFNNPISGNGTLLVAADIAGNTFYGRLAVDNPDFSGKIIMSHPINRVNGDNKTTNVLEIACGGALGGPYAGEDGWKALQVSNEAEVVALDTLTLSEATRGLFVDNGAIFRVPAKKTMTINWPITWGGDFIKYGPGAIKLGGAAKFVDRSGATPVQVETAPAGAVNRMLMREGTLELASARSLNGVSVVMSSGTSIVLDPDTTEAELKSSGIVNTATLTPFAVETSGTISVQLKSGYTPTSAAFEVPICTVSKDASALSLTVEPIRSYKVQVVSRTDDSAGTKTYYASFERYGLYLIIK